MPSTGIGLRPIRSSFRSRHEVGPQRRRVIGLGKWQGVGPKWIYCKGWRRRGSRKRGGSKWRRQWLWKKRGRPSRRRRVLSQRGWSPRRRIALLQMRQMKKRDKPPQIRRSILKRGIGRPQQRRSAPNRRGGEKGKLVQFVRN